VALALLTTLLFLAGQETGEPQLPPPQGEAPEWELSSSFFYSGPPDDHGYGTGILYADRGALHLEGRYNYEDLDTASLWAGWTLASEGEQWSLSATPMLGAVFGQTEGVAPGLEVDASWWRVGWYAEAEYLFDLEDSDDDFFYMWSTLMLGVTDWLRAGIVTERSKLIDTDLDVQRGLALEFTVDVVQLGLCTYNLGDEDDQYSVISAAVSF
jgi:hypothetical protein